MIFNCNENELNRGFIDKNEILKYVTEEDIFELVFNYKPKELDYVTSPFREDDNPGCWFQYNSSGKLKFTDFGSNIYIKNVKMINIDCFDAVRYFYNLGTYYETLKFIEDKLIRGKELPKVERNTETKTKSKKRVGVYFEARDFEERDAIFWKQYGISKQNLIDDKVFPVKSFNIQSSNKASVNIKTFDLCYAYTNFSSGHKKLYRPHQRKEYKFITNCNQDDVGGIETLPARARLLVITKSYKDYRVLKNTGLNVVWFQNEGMIPEWQILLHLCNRFEKVFLFFDNDKTGIEASYKIRDMINNYLPGICTSIHLPIKFLEQGVKDPADLVCKKGKQKLMDFLNESLK